MLKMSIIIFLSILSLIIKSESALTPDKSLAQLMEGNERFATGQYTHTHLEEEAREKQSGPQAPFAIIIGCSDSRVPPELIFDQGLGDLFVVRDAGNLVGDIELDSVEFAVLNFNVPLIMVLGHQDCGAVKAVLENKKKIGELDAIYPMIASAIANCQGKEANKLINCIYCNVRQSMQTLNSSPHLTPYIRQKKLKIVGGYYDLNSGKVSIIK